jgi:hypothetical protein
MYTIIDETTHLVTHLSVTAEERDLMENFLFVPAHEVECAVGQKLDRNTGLFHDVILTIKEFRAAHALVFSASDVVILRQLEGSITLTPAELDEWKVYRTELRARFHSYTPTPNYQWPVTPLIPQP